MITVSPARTSYAFSLVELSIVLVILGLLIGGILSGQSLIRAAELRSVSASMQNYTTAYYMFRDKYFSLPGDMNTATRFWNSAGGTGADVACLNAQTNTSPATCNGTGDGTILSSTGSTHGERFLAWKHLANAGLVEGSYSGKSNGAVDTTYVAARGENLPAGKISGSIFDWSYVAESTSGVNYFAGSQFDTNVLSMYGANAKPEEAWNIDTKIDDGSPVYGKFVVHKPSSTSNVNTCTTSDADTATYNLTVTSPQCVVLSILH
jgi:prepilin-type N-terminal cleavage/methylation domain-containing protein